MATQARRMKKLKPSLLQLDGFWLEAFSLRANPQASPEMSAGPIALSYEVDYLDPSEGNSAGPSVRLHVRSQRPRNRAYFYEIDVTIAGRFSFSRPISDDALAERLIRYNTLAILYRVVRGILGLVTAKSEFGPVELPSANFLAN